MADHVTAVLDNNNDNSQISDNGVMSVSFLETEYSSGKEKHTRWVAIFNNPEYFLLLP